MDKSGGLNGANPTLAAKHEKRREPRTDPTFA
jgi:hypothetical protein